MHKISVLFLQKLDLRLKLVFDPQVIGIKKCKIPTFYFLKAPVTGKSRPSVFALLDYDETRIPLTKALRLFNTVIRRSIINNDAFPICESLIQHTLKCPLDKELRIITRDHD